MEVEIMTPTKISSTYPKITNLLISRENMLETIEEYFHEGHEVVLAEGAEGIGKSTLLYHFCENNIDNVITLFIRKSNKYSYDSEFVKRDLCDQMNWIVEKKSLKSREINDNLFGSVLQDLQKQARLNNTSYYFVIDGIDEIPDDSGLKEEIIDIFPYGFQGFKILFSSRRTLF